MSSVCAAAARGGSPGPACAELHWGGGDMAPNPDVVVVHPLVLLSVVDHYNRVAKDTRKRVVGVLLGEFSKGTTDVTNSFAGGLPCGQTLCCIDAMLLRISQWSASYPAAGWCVMGMTIE
jgi:JAB1/Mov34/MPN/PAD-1 ubiquitin protease